MQPGLIAGAGELPHLLIKSWQNAGYKPAIIGIDGFAGSEITNNSNAAIFSLGAAGKMIAFLKENQVTDLVITGEVRRPDFFKLKPDPKGMMVMARILFKKKMGDDALLRLIRAEIEKEGFKIRAVQEFVPSILMPEGLLTKAAPLEGDRASIEIGLRASQDLGRKDLGQSVVVQNESVIGREGDNGTNALIFQAGIDKQIGRGPILVKTCKPQQDKALDFPTAGLSTVQAAAKAGFSGVVLEAGNTILLDREAVIAFCDASNIFLYGAAL